MADGKKTFVDRLKQPTTWLVIALVAAFVYGLLRGPTAQAATLELPPAHRVTIGVGYGLIHAQGLVVQELGYEYDDRWTVRLTRTGNDARIPDTWVGAVGRRVPLYDGKHFSPFVAIGAAWFDEPPSAVVDSRLVFDLEVGVRYRNVVDLVWHHNSTSGRSDPNSGIDYWLLRAVLKVR